MSKPNADPDDWSPRSEALFDAARGAHAPTEADRARVRQALSQKLAAAGAPAADGDVQPRLTDAVASRAALGNVVKATLGVAVVMAGAFTVMRATEPQTQAEATSIATHAAAPAAKPAQRAAQPEIAAGDAAEVVKPVPPPPSASGSDASASAAAVRRSRAPAKAAKAAKVSVPGTGPARTEGNATDLERPASEQRSRPERAQPSLPAATSRGPSPRDEPPIEQDTAEARAELAFMARINVAMRSSTPQAVLALCAEHERRWPHGTFAQEREGLRAIASCNAQAVDAAARARTFLASHAQGPLAARVRDECASQLAAAAER